MINGFNVVRFNSMFIKPSPIERNIAVRILDDVPNVAVLMVSDLLLRPKFAFFERSKMFVKKSVVSLTSLFPPVVATCQVLKEYRKTGIDFFGKRRCHSIAFSQSQAVDGQTGYRKLSIDHSLLSECIIETRSLRAFFCRRNSDLHSKNSEI